jgi:hypothetical protein
MLGRNGNMAYWVACTVLVQACIGSSQEMILLHYEAHQPRVERCEWCGVQCLCSSG